MKVGDTVELRHSAELTRGKVVKVVSSEAVAVRWETRTGHEGKTTEERVADLRRVSG